MKKAGTWSLQRGLAALALVLGLAACGGGGGTTEPALPDTLDVVAPATRQALDTDISFSSNADDPAGLLSHHWDFGDGSSSDLPAPRHAYARSGTYTVQLTLRNQAGTVLQASQSITVADLAIVQGRQCSGADSGGWCWQNPLPQGNTIQSHFWLDAQRGWAVGDQGTVLTTSDGGSNWTAQHPGISGQLLTVLFVNAQVGWIGGSNGLLLKTSDGGSSWQPQSLGVDTAVRSLGVVDASTAWVTADSGSYMTRDGGNSWQRTTPPLNTYNDLQRTSPTTLWGRAYSGSGIALQRTVDNGSTWSVVSPPASAAWQTQNVDSFQFVDDLRGIMRISGYEVDGGTQGYRWRVRMLQTRDGGASWQALPNPPSYPTEYSPDYKLTPDGTLFTPSYTTANAIDYSSDGGASWRSMQRPPAGNAYHLDYLPYSSSRVLQRLSDGRMLMTSDAGISWTELRSGNGNNSNASAANSIWFFNAREGLALSDNGTSLRTSDGGQTWLPQQNTLACCYSWSGLSFSADGSTGWAISGTGQIYRSSDRGQTWLSPVAQTSISLGQVLDYHFVDSSHGWALSGDYWWSNTGTLFSSTDGGNSWQAVPDSSSLAGMRALRFADRSHGVAVGAAGVAMLSSDGGASWRARPTGSAQVLNKLAFVDAQTVVAVGNGGTMLRSTDQGQTWQRLPSITASNLTGLRFASAKVGHAVGDQGVLLSTDDGGLSWRDASPQTQLALRGVFFLDADTGWAVGSNGSILATISGGR